MKKKSEYLEKFHKAQCSFAGFVWGYETVIIPGNVDLAGVRELHVTVHTLAAMSLEANDWAGRSFLLDRALRQLTLMLVQLANIADAVADEHNAQINGESLCVK